MSRNQDRLTAAFHQFKSDIKTFITPKTYKNLTQNQIIGGLTVLLLVIGVITGVYLGSERQDIRQEASFIYPICGAGSPSNCAQGTLTGSGCNLSGFPGTCQNTDTNPICSCVLTTPSPTSVPNGVCPASDRCVDNAATCSSLGGSITQDRCGTANSDFCCNLPQTCEAPAVCTDNSVACNGNGGQLTGKLCGSPQNGLCCIFPSATPSIVIPTITPFDRGCADSGGTCKTSCSSNETNEGLCTGSSSGPVCCKPNPTNPPGDNGCADSGGTCRAAGSCLGGEVQTGLCSGAGSGPVCCKPASCIVENQSCTSSSQCCNNAVCAGVTGAKTCQQVYCERSGPNTGSNSCTDKNAGASCVNNAQVAGVCRPTIPDQASTECDCVTGPTATPRPTSIVSSSTPTNTPVPPTGVPPTDVPPTDVPPTNTPIIAPVCVNVTVNNLSTNTPNAPIAEGHQVTLTCSNVANATYYRFRMVRPPNNAIDDIPASSTSYVSSQYTIRTGGAHVAQCVPCNANGCAPWAAY